MSPGIFQESYLIFPFAFLFISVGTSLVYTAVICHSVYCGGSVTGLPTFTLLLPKLFMQQLEGSFKNKTSGHVTFHRFLKTLPFIIWFLPTSKPSPPIFPSQPTQAFFLFLKSAESFLASEPLLFLPPVCSSGTANGHLIITFLLK